jgi:hypothetical protein
LSDFDDEAPTTYEDAVETLREAAEWNEDLRARRASLASRFAYDRSSVERSSLLESSVQEASRDHMEPLHRIDTAARSRQLRDAAEKEESVKPLEDPERPKPTRQYDQRLYLSLLLTFKKDVIVSWIYGCISGTSRCRDM